MRDDEHDDKTNWNIDQWWRCTRYGCGRASSGSYGAGSRSEVYAIYEGYQGLVDGGKYIHKMNWDL